jgi:bacteriocin biosynthesis cyclodehydratase domain-containing protein
MSIELTTDAPASGARTRALMVNPNLRIARCSDDEVMIKHGARSTFSELLRDDKRTKLLGRVLERLRTPASLADLADEGLVAAPLEGVVAGLLDHLHAEGVLIEPDSDLALAYVDTVLERGGAGSARLMTQRLAVLGAGALAGRIARNLAVFHPAALAVVQDPGEGEGHAAALARELDDGGTQATAATVSLADEFALRDALADVDFAVVAPDAYSPRVLHAVNAAAIALERTWMAVHLDGSDGIVGPIHVPGESACHLEVEMQQEAAIGFRDDYLVYKEALDNELALDRFLLPPHLDTIAGLASGAALRFLVSGRSFVVGRMVRVDFERMGFDTQEVLRLPRCPACVQLQPAYQHEFL